MHLGSTDHLVTARRDNGWGVEARRVDLPSSPVHLFAPVARRDFARRDPGRGATRAPVAEGIAFHDQVDASLPQIEVVHPTSCKRSSPLE